ncbi:MAG: nucleoside monophosphate kinase [Cytophagales bacterium]|nr:nucleoside monophosphate kinase [Armatimonadota bacterium]
MSEGSSRAGRVVFLGPPGAGKGTQGNRLASFWGVPHVASGDLLRRILQNREGSALAAAIRVIDKGSLVPDETVGQVVFEALDLPGAQRGFVLDGYPRSVDQARDLERYLSERRRPLQVVIGLRIGEAALIARLSGRLTCPNCGASYHVMKDPPQTAGVCDQCGNVLAVREDDQPGPIRTRLMLYHQKTEPLLSFYRERGMLREVDAEGDEAKVFERVLASSGGLEKSLIY